MGTAAVTRGRPLNGTLALVDARLAAWGREMTGGLPAIGYPACTVLGRVIEFGPMAAAQGGGKTPPADPAIADVDRAVALLTMRYRRCIRAWYIGGTAYNQVVAARAVRLDAREFAETLKHARLQVAEHLGMY